MKASKRLELGLAIAGILVGIGSTAVTLLSRRRGLELTKEQLALLSLLSEPSPLSSSPEQPESRSARFDRGGFKRRT